MPMASLALSVLAALLLESAAPAAERVKLVEQPLSRLLTSTAADKVAASKDAFTVDGVVFYFAGPPAGLAADLGRVQSDPHPIRTYGTPRESNCEIALYRALVSMAANVRQLQGDVVTDVRSGPDGEIGAAETYICQTVSDLSGPSGYRVMLTGTARTSDLAPTRLPRPGWRAFAAVYDGNAPVQVKGAVVSLEWTKPRILLRMVDASTGQKWTFEGSDPEIMAASGVTREQLRPGTQIVVRGYQAINKACSPDCLASARHITFPNGEGQQ
jgi:hypothetical protein